MKTHGMKRVLIAGLTAAAVLVGSGYTQAMPSPLVVIDKSLAEIFYRNDAGKEILFRMAKGDSDISGDNTVYEVNQVVQTGRQYIRVKGSEKLVSLVLWSRGGYTFSLSFEEPLPVEAVQAIVGTIPWN